MAWICYTIATGPILTYTGAVKDEAYEAVAQRFHGMSASTLLAAVLQRQSTPRHTNTATVGSARSFVGQQAAVRSLYEDTTLEDISATTSRPIVLWVLMDYESWLDTYHDFAYSYHPNLPFVSPQERTNRNFRSQSRCTYRTRGPCMQQSVLPAYR